MSLMNTVKTFDEYLAVVKSIYLEIEAEVPSPRMKALFFRGHTRSSYQLLPSALRNGGNGTERDHLLNYRDNMPRHSAPYHFIKQRPEILSDMQHFGMKTRLMDWTFSPLVALYFALKDESGNENSEVCVFNPWKYRNTFFAASTKESAHAHEMHILARALLSSHSVLEIQNILKGEFYGQSLSTEDLKLPFAFVAKYGNPRLIHQAGCFTIHGSLNAGEHSHTPLDCSSEVSSSPGIIHKVQIQKDSRTEMFNDLNRLFINHYSVFPDLEGMSQHFKEYDSLYSTRRSQQLS